MAALTRIKVRSLSPIREEVFLRLRQAIVSGELAPGARLVERELAAQLGVSRTPVREAFRRLEQEGLVEQSGRRALRVRELSPQDARDVLQIRSVLEGLAAELAAANAQGQHLRRLAGLVVEMDRAVEAGDARTLGELNDRFNAALYAAAGSPRLSGMLAGLREQVSRLARRGYEVPGRARDAVAEHRRIVEAIAARDPEAARQAALQHVQRSQASLMAALTEAARPGERAAAPPPRAAARPDDPNRTPSRLPRARLPRARVERPDDPAADGLPRAPSRRPAPLGERSAARGAPGGTAAP